MFGVDHSMGERCFNFKLLLNARENCTNVVFKRGLWYLLHNNSNTYFKWSSTILINCDVWLEFFLLVASDLGNGKGRSLL